MTLELLTLLVLGLKCGSELNIAAFAHPALNRQPLETHILMRSSFAALFGRVMPFWMTGSALWCFPSSFLCPSTIGLPSGRRKRCRPIGAFRNTAGICTTPFAPQDWLWPSPRSRWLWLPIERTSTNSLRQSAGWSIIAVLQSEGGVRCNLMAATE